MTTTTTQGKSRQNAAARRKTATQSTPASQDRSEQIAVAAYFKAQARGFAPGQELDDWLEAESELS
ncbi:MAG TPA: DUF2934 domain-containing protein [Rhodocyclaceae bacterium]|nr:DUF2934 domain-containing protein [Rhodocyclaceae bacterium]